MTFFYELNKRMAELANKQDLHESKVAESEKWIQKAVNPANKGNLHKALHVAQGEKIPKAKIEKATHSKNPKLRHMAQFAKNVTNEGHCSACESAPCKCDSMDESALQAYLGNKKYGKQGMDALRKAGREHASKDKMDQIRNRYDKMDEADMEEGNAFSGAVANAKMDHKSEFEVDGKKYKVVEADPTGLAEKKKAKPDYIDLDGDGNRKETMKKAVADKKKEPRSKGTAFDKEHMDQLRKEKEAETHSRYDVQDTGYSKRYTRKADPETDNDDAETSDAPKKRGRPAGPKKGPERTTKGAWKHKGERKVKEDGMPITDRGEYDDEAGMAKDSLHTIVRSAKELEQALRSNENLPEWVQEKIGQIKGMMSSVTDYILSTHERDSEQQVVPEVAPPGAKAERMVKHIKKSLSKDGKLSDKDKAIAYATTWKAKKAGKVEEEGKPDFLDLDKDGDKKEPMKKAVKDKKEDKVDETTVAGSVATAPTSGKSSKGGMQFGKGVYESINAKIENMITESMSVNVSVDDMGKKSINVSATEEDAEALAQLLKMAGLAGGEQKQEVCPGCGSADCGCDEEMVDENSPDWPTNKETLAAEPELRTYSGGLNGPKSTGQSTTPVLASQLRRQASMEENVALERSLFKTWQNYKG